ncbi:hypothetical protein JST97_31615 [bacterium]|nr:hypothetical protein [bacterium]
MTSRDDLGGLLQQLTSEGLLDSAGHFTLDSRKAWDKARGLRFADAGQYLRCLYRGAVLGEATQVDFYVDSDDTVMSFDGPALSSSQLRFLISSLYVDDSSWCARKLQQLALGIHGCWGQGYAWAEIHSQDVAFRYDPGRPDPQPVAARPGPLTNCVRLKRPFGMQVVQRYLSPQLPEDQILLSGLGWSDIATTYNGRQLARNRCRQNQFRLDHGLPKSLRLANWQPAIPLEMPDCPLELSLLFDLLPNQQDGKFRLLVADVEVPRDYSLPGCHGMSALVAVGPLLLDASQTYVVENEEFRALVNLLREAWVAGVIKANATRSGRFEYLHLLHHAQREMDPSSPLYPKASELLSADEPAPNQTHAVKKRRREERRANFIGAVQRGENLFIPLVGTAEEELCFQEESRKVLLGRQGRTVASWSLGDLVEVRSWEEAGRIFLRLAFADRELDFWQPIRNQNQQKLRAQVEHLRLQSAFSSARGGPPRQ